MALVQTTIAEFFDPATGRRAGVAFEYDDVTLLLTNILWANRTSQPMWVQLTRTATGQSVEDTVPANTPVRRRNVSAAGIVGEMKPSSHGATFLDFGVAVQTQYPAA
jgi:hypothetical protein